MKITRLASNKLMLLGYVANCVGGEAKVTKSDNNRYLGSIVYATIEVNLKEMEEVFHNKANQPPTSDDTPRPVSNINPVFNINSKNWKQIRDRTYGILTDVLGQPEITQSVTVLSPIYRWRVADIVFAIDHDSIPALRELKIQMLVGPQYKIKRWLGL